MYLFGEQEMLMVSVRESDNRAKRNLYGTYLQKNEDRAFFQYTTQYILLKWKQHAIVREVKQTLASRAIVCRQGCRIA